MDLQEYLARRREMVDQALDDMLPPEHNDPPILYRAMRYSLFAGGKRIRPILAMSAAEVVGGDAMAVLPLAVSLECIHTYSLIHDDLPAMDDDDLRRGRPTSHKVFGEAVAVLAGDALLTFAFECLAAPATARRHRSDRLVAVISELAAAAGSSCLIAGQVLDMLSEGRDVGEDTVTAIVKGKTAALIRASLTCGARLAGGSSEEIELLGLFGGYLGTAFQVKDDLLDLEGDPEKLGKAVKKDQQRGKATYPRLMGPVKAKELLQDLIESAGLTLRPLGARAELLVALGRYLGERVN